MSLFISDDERFEVVVNYKINDNKELEFFDKKESDQITQEKFYFKRPNWIEAKTMSSASVLVDAVSGRAIIDPYKYMDIRFKLLLKDWILSKDNRKVEMTSNNIDKLHPSLIQYLFSKLEEELTVTGKEEPKKTNTES